MKRKAIVSVALGLAGALTAGVAMADFSPKFDLTLSDTKVKGNPALDIHLEFDAEDEEIGNFSMKIPAGFNIAPDAKVPNDEEVGGGEVTIEAGPACRPGPEGGIPVSAPATVPATIIEQGRTDDEIDAGVKAVYLLDLRPVNEVRLRITGSKKKGWTMSGAPTPSDNTCNPLIVDLSINSTSESGVKLVTNPATAGKYNVKATITSQDSPDVATFIERVKIK